MPDYWGNPSCDEIFGTPEEVITDSRWPDEDKMPLRMLKAICLGHMGEHELVGSPFRWSDETIRLDMIHDTSWDSWLRLQVKNGTSRFWCPICRERTLHAPKGSVVV